MATFMMVGLPSYSAKRQQQPAFSMKASMCHKWLLGFNKNRCPVLLLRTVRATLVSTADSLIERSCFYRMYHKYIATTDGWMDGWMDGLSTVQCGTDASATDVDGNLLRNGNPAFKEALVHTYIAM